MALTEKTPAPPESDPTPRSDERRKLLQTLGGGSVLMTVLSRPVYGGTTCLAASIAISMAATTSRAPAAASICYGLTPTQWKAHANQWPTPYCAVSSFGMVPTLYHCPTTGFSGQIFGDRSMLEVIDMQESGFGVGSLGRYMVAALLNARSGRTPVLNETTVRAMWNSMVSRGYYEPAPGVQWTSAELIAYIKTTMG
jgi:hypothetical protein